MMHCRQAQQQLEQLKPENEPDLLAHLRRCHDCREYAEDLRVARLLRTMPAPEPEAGFESRVLRTAISQSRGVPQGANAVGWKLATAASLLLAIFLALPRQAPTPAEPVGQLAGTVSPGVMPVTLALKSGRDLAGAKIRVVMPEHLEVDGFENQRDLQWRTDLKAGANRLTLPIRQRNDRGNDVILIEIEHEGARREFRVPVPGGNGAVLQGQDAQGMQKI
ncbi:hypothetical protein [Microbulbifer sp. YPW16]|uniref:hypothetical protein n=1 Tax=Microbulbifer sp. YPW16 TaxID=2904242 RepID=UPI001E2D3C02|nr:hypothetical protein [Microbulbifer sp. YPW16]UHQ54306.1 hypothetical protein LVE68_12360 [Microbulbifer sp. YPW16]